MLAEGVILDLSDIEVSYLRNGADNPYHFHSHDQIPTHATLLQLEALEAQKSVSTSTYTATGEDDYLLCSATTTITLPRAINGTEIEIIKSFAGGYVKIVPSGTDLIMGTTSMTILVQYTACHLKSTSLGWLLV